MSIQQSNGAVNLQAALNRLVKAGTVDPNILLKYSQNPPPDLGDKGALLVSLASSIVARNKDGMNASMPAPSETVTEQVQNKLAQSDQPQGIASLNPSPMMPSKIMAQAPQTKMEDQGVAGLSIPDQMFSGQSMAAGGIVGFDDGGDVGGADAAPMSADMATTSTAPDSADMTPESDLPSDYYMSGIQRSLMGSSPVRYTGATASPAFASSSPYGTDMTGEMMRVSPEALRYSYGVGRGTSPYAGSAYRSIRKEMGSPGYANGGIVAFAAGDLVKDPYAAFRMPIPKIPTADDLVMETQELKSGFVDPDFYKKRKQDLEAQTLEDIKESREADKANVLFKLAEGFGTTPGGFVRGAVAAGVKAGPAIAEMNKNIIAAKRLNRAALNELEQAKYAESIGDFKTAAALKESARTKEFEAQKVNATTGATIEAAQIKSAAARAMDPANTRTKALNATIQQFEKIYGQGSYLTSFKQKKTNLMNEFNQMLKNNLNFIREEELPEASLETTPKADSSKTTKKEIKTPVKETQAQYQNRIKEEKARQKYPQLYKNYDQISSDAGGTLINPTDAEEMNRLERLGRFENVD